MISFAIATYMHLHQEFIILILRTLAYMIFGIDILFIPNHTSYSTPVVSSSNHKPISKCACM